MTLANARRLEGRSVIATLMTPRTLSLAHVVKQLAISWVHALRKSKIRLRIKELPLLSADSTTDRMDLFENTLVISNMRDDAINLVPAEAVCNLEMSAADNGEN